jgi:MFS family permease
MLHAVIKRLNRVSGGPARSQVVAILALVLALDSADLATVGALAGKLETALRISNGQLGVIAAVPSFMMALATIPIGLLADRIRRVPVLVVGVVVWAIGEGVSGLSQGFWTLLMLRVAVGVGSAPTGPTVVSLVGDYFPARDRAQMWGLILSGELLGAGFGFLVAGELATVLNWHYSFYALSLPTLAVSYVVWRWLPEPARGGRSQLERGARTIDTHEQTGSSRPQEDEFEETAAQHKVAESGVPAREELILRRDPLEISLWRAVLYTLRIRTNLVLIIASAFGYFYFQGVETFGIVFVRARFGISQRVAVLFLVAIGLSALVGVVASGWLADRLLRRGRITARITIGGVSFLGAALLFLPGLLFRSLGVAMVFYVAAGIMFGSRDPPLDAARLDIMHHRLWGRAESVRTVLRRTMVASAAIVFGVLADQLGRGRPLQGVHGFGAHAGAEGMRLTFLILLVFLLAGGLLTLSARRTYPGDVSTALASEEATAVAA